MGPAIWIRRIGRLVAAQRAAPVPIQPDRKPRLRRLVIQNNRVAKGVGKRTLTTGVGDTGEGQAAVGGTRYARELVDCGTSRVIESYANLIGVIWVSRTVCLGLNNVWRGLRPRDQVNVHVAV